MDDFGEFSTHNKRHNNNNNKRSMGDLSVIKHLFILGIVSTVLNSYFLVCIVSATLAACIYDGIAWGIHPPYKLFFTITTLEHLISVIIHVPVIVVTIIGSCLGFMQQRNIRKYGLYLISVCNTVYFILFVLNVIELVVGFVILENYVKPFLNIITFPSPILMVFISVFHIIVVAYNFVYIIYIYKSCNQVIPA